MTFKQNLTTASIIIIVLMGLFSCLMNILSDIAASELSEAFEPHRWLAWPLLAILALTSIVLTIWQFYLGRHAAPPSRTDEPREQASQREQPTPRFRMPVQKPVRSRLAADDAFASFTSRGETWRAIALKAGLAGGSVVAVLQLVGLIPCVGCLTSLLSWVTHVGAGVLSAYWLPIPRSAGVGALAGLVTGIIGGIFGMVASGIQFAITDSASVLSQIPQESLDALTAAGMNLPTYNSIGAVIVVGALCWVVGMIIGAVLGAISGRV